MPHLRLPMPHFSLTSGPLKVPEMLGTISHINPYPWILPKKPKPGNIQERNSWGKNPTQIYATDDVTCFKYLWYRLNTPCCFEIWLRYEQVFKCSIYEVTRIVTIKNFLDFCPKMTLLDIPEMWLIGIKNKKIIVFKIKILWLLKTVHNFCL